MLINSPGGEPARTVPGGLLEADGGHVYCEALFAV